jgi:8-oxo-dGTP diphosphatase
MKIQVAGCVVLDDYGRMLLLHRAGDDVSWWELPGGKLEQGETADQAAVRELGEELGVQVDLRGTLATGVFEHDTNEYAYTWFRAKIVTGEPTIFEPELFDDFDFFDPEDLPGLALSPYMSILLDKLVSGEVVLGT